MIQPEDLAFDPPDTVRKAYEAGQQGKRFIDALGLEDIIVGTDTDGPCERFMQSVPFIQGLYRSKPAYEVGRALLLIGANLDALGLGTHLARAFVRHLTDAIRLHNAKIDADHWTAEQTFDLLGSFPLLDRSSLSETNAERWAELKAYLLSRVAGPKGSGDCSYSHPSLALICEEIVPATRSIHVTPELYFELEDASWSSLSYKDIPTNAAFVVHVDGDRWAPAIDDAEQFVRTDYLFAAFDPQGAVVLEHTSWKGGRFPNIHGRVVGCDFHRATGALEWRSSENALVDGKRVRCDPPNREKDRIFRVAISFLALVKHAETQITPISGNKLLHDHFNLTPPTTLSVDEAILTVMLRSAGKQ